jgi:DNA-binding XRE family transcriptional regulator
MNATKQKKLVKAGWIVGSTSDFIKLSEAEETVITIKMALAAKLKSLRTEQHLTQQEFAKNIRSSQSRVAKMENADRSVSMELFVKSLAALGASSEQIGSAICSKRTPKTRKRSRIKERQSA